MSSNITAFQDPVFAGTSFSSSPSSVKQSISEYVSFFPFGKVRAFIFHYYSKREKAPQTLKTCLVVGASTCRAQSVEHIRKTTHSCIFDTVIIQPFGRKAFVSKEIEGGLYQLVKDGRIKHLHVADCLFSDGGYSDYRDSFIDRVNRIPLLESFSLKKGMDENYSSPYLKEIDAEREFFEKILQAETGRKQRLSSPYDEGNVVNTLVLSKITVPINVLGFDWEVHVESLVHLFQQMSLNF